MKIKKCEFNTNEKKEDVSIYTIENQKGNYVELLDYGATIHSVVLDSGKTEKIDIVLGYDTLGEYENGKDYFGAFIGRVANRIEKAQFELEDKAYELATNDGKNHLHGGVNGFDKRMYKAVLLNDGVCFERISEDMEEGYPGNLRVKVTYRFNDNNVLLIHYEAEADKTTPVNLTNHVFFNLNGHDSGSIEGHLLQVNADFFTPNTDECIPDGSIVPVGGTPFDFRSAKK